MKPPFLDSAIIGELRGYQQREEKPHLGEVRRAVGCSKPEFDEAIQRLRFSGKLHWERYELSPSMLLSPAAKEPPKADGAARGAGSARRGEPLGTYTPSLPGPSTRRHGSWAIRHSDDAVGRMIELHGDGLSGGAIGKRLGLSRNAVIGKINRIRLAMRAAGIKLAEVADHLAEGGDVEAFNGAEPLGNFALAEIRRGLGRQAC